MPRSLTRVKPMSAVFTFDEPEVMVQIVRLLVLYEDLKVEIGVMLIPDNKHTDELSSQYRKMYTLRRAWATLVEMESALHKLNMTKAFKMRRRGFSKQDLRKWTAAIRFFANGKAFLHNQRNVYGAHFHDDAAKFVLGKVDDSPAALEVKMSDDDQHHYVFKFAQEFVSMALFYDRGERDIEEFMKTNMDFLSEAMRFAAHATQLLADHYILPRFGW